MDPKKITLTELADGAAEEMFQIAFAELLENVDDPSTPWKARRRVTLTFDLVIDETRKEGQIVVGCLRKMPEARPTITRVHLGRHQGTLAAVEALRQENLFPEPAGRPREVSAS